MHTRIITYIIILGSIYIFDNNITISLKKKHNYFLVLHLPSTLSVVNIFHNTIIIYYSFYYDRDMAQHCPPETRQFCWIK